MIYECAILAKQDADEKEVEKLLSIVSEVAKENKGEIIIQDDWGVKLLAQETKKGVDRGRYLYFLIKADSENNKELTRRLNINENVIKFMILTKGADETAADIAKNYKTPFSKKYRGSVIDREKEEDEGIEVEGERRRFSKAKGCWYISRKLRADWKDPNTYLFLVNEFGKIGGARMAGVSTKHQRWATQAIKQARNISLLDHMSNRTASME